jgi:hypothetical protein
LSCGQHRTGALSENLSELSRVVRDPSSNRGLVTRTRS